MSKPNLPLVVVLVISGARNIMIGKISSMESQMFNPILI